MKLDDVISAKQAKIKAEAEAAAASCKASLGENAVRAGTEEQA